MKESLKIEELKQRLIDVVQQTDDIVAVIRCLTVMGVSAEDNLADNMSIASQLKEATSDKQLLVRDAMKETTSSFKAEKQELDDDEPAPPTNSKGRKVFTWCLAAAAAILAGWLLFTFVPWKREKKEHGVVTVAERYKTFNVNGCTFNLVYVDGGTFTMGATEEQGDEADSDETPLFQVTLSDYMIGETEVTQQLWTAVMGVGPIPYDGDLHPMKNISHDDCIIFINKLNKITGMHFYLPTEAQWEFAARGGNKSKHYRFAGSDDIEDVGWYSTNSWDKGKGDPDFGNHAVGSKQPNELGLYDMSGNVWEWCADYYGKYSSASKTNPLGPENPTASFRVNRGGSWDYIATSSRTSNRRNRTPDFRNFNLGMRLAHEPIK